MPRTKRPLKENVSENVKPTSAKLVNEMISSYLRDQEAKLAMKEVNLENKVHNILLNIRLKQDESLIKFRQYANKTLVELKNVTFNEHTTYDRTAKKLMTNSTRARPARKSSSSATRKGRTSRATSATKQARPRLSKLNTPVNPPSKMFGTITPKVKPNSVQAILRRPQQGETAVSMQGSPLLIDHVVPNKKANVNIPLHDGRVFSILPEHGLRLSQIPDLDDTVRRQIQTLRDNLEELLGDKY